MGFPTGILGSTLVASLPATFELIGAVCVLFLSKGIPPKVQAALQNFSAGIIIAAIGSGIFPLLEEKIAKGESVVANLGAILIGFAFALVLMYTIKSIGEEGPQYQEELVVGDIDKDSSSFIGLDEVSIEMDSHQDPTPKSGTRKEASKPNAPT